MMNTSTTKIATLNSLPANNQCGLLKLNIHTATGGHIEINMGEKETVSSLKWRLSRKLKISTEKMSLLFKDRPLKEGSLLDNFVTDNSKILLLPNMESGMTFQRPEVGVIQGLENLTESQVNDFLSGRAPLLLVMKLGDHMMFVQLQLSTAASCIGQGSQTNRSAGCTMVDSKEKAASTGPLFNSAALAELGQNLSQKLREFSQLSTHQKVSEQCTSVTPTPSPASTANSSNNSTSTYSVSKNVTAHAPATHTQLPIPENKSSDNHSNHPHHPTTNTSIAPHSSSCNPSNTCATTTPSPVPATRTCPTTGEQIPGAIIESMQHIGQGVYSGTFSGTLDPSLQDNDGKPKRNIGTIIHILNDLLGATPQYRPPQNLPHTTEKKSLDSCGHKSNELSQSLIGLSDEDNALRGKVKDLQMKMEEKRMRRQARREAKAPYHYPGGPRPNAALTFPTSATTTNYALTNNTDLISHPDICSTETELSIFAPPQHPECTVTEMEIADESIIEGGDSKNQEIEMTALPTPSTATTTTTTKSPSSASAKATEPSSYANSGLEQESVLV